MRCLGITSPQLILTGNFQISKNILFWKRCIYFQVHIITNFCYRQASSLPNPWKSTRPSRQTSTRLPAATGSSDKSSTSSTMPLFSGNRKQELKQPEELSQPRPAVARSAQRSFNRKKPLDKRRLRNKQKHIE